MKYTVKQIAELMGMSEHTIRYYTDLNLLPVKRDSGNRRVFDEESINWLMGIKCLKGCGMSIEDIKRYGDLCLQGDETLAERREIMRSHAISRDLQQWYLVIHLRLPILQSLRIRTRESFLYQCLDTALMSVMKAMV